MVGITGIPEGAAVLARFDKDSWNTPIHRNAVVISHIRYVMANDHTRFADQIESSHGSASKGDSTPSRQPD